MTEETVNDKVIDTEGSFVEDSQKCDNPTPPEKKDDDIVVDVITQDEAEKQLDALMGVVFKINNILFKVKYINKGQRRFSAEAINDVVPFKLSKPVMPVEEPPKA